MFFHVDVIIYFVLTCCADSKVSERLAAYPLLRSFLRGRLVVLAPFPALFRSPASARLCTCLFMLRSKQSRAYVFRYCVTVAEADVRVRVRGRVVSVHRQRRQVRVVSVVAAAETTNRRISAAALSFLIKELNLTTGGYSDSLVRFGRWHGFLLQRCRTTSPHYAGEMPSGVYRKKRGHPHRWR